MNASLRYIPLSNLEMIEEEDKDVREENISGEITTGLRIKKKRLRFQNRMAELH